jgi:N-methylhydantoinase A/oxoprolinase/acetone carboxylase beta subunit
VAIELLTIRVNVASNRKPFAMPSVIQVSAEAECNNIQYCKVYAETAQAILLARANLLPGELLQGPAVITEYSATTFVASTWNATVDEIGNLILTKQAKTTSQPQVRLG